MLSEPVSQERETFHIPIVFVFVFRPCFLLIQADINLHIYHYSFLDRHLKRKVGVKSDLTVGGCIIVSTKMDKCFDS